RTTSAGFRPRRAGVRCRYAVDWGRRMGGRGADGPVRAHLPLAHPPIAPMLSEQEQVRRAHLDALRAHGVEPFPAAEWAPTHRAADVLAAYDDARHDPEREGTEPIRVRLAGRMGPARVMGKAAFFHLADESGRIQVYVRRDDVDATA